MQPARGADPPADRIDLLHPKDVLASNATAPASGTNFAAGWPAASPHPAAAIALNDRVGRPSRSLVQAARASVSTTVLTSRQRASPALAVPENCESSTYR